MKNVSLDNQCVVVEPGGGGGGGGGGVLPYMGYIGMCQGSRLTFLMTSPVASDSIDFTSQNQFFTSQNFQA